MHQAVGLPVSNSNIYKVGNLDKPTNKLAHDGTEKKVFHPQCFFDGNPQI